MKEEDKKYLEVLKEKRDWEGFHEAYDAIMYRRLKELDPDFAEELIKAEAGATFWFA